MWGENIGTTDQGAVQNMGAHKRNDEKDSLNVERKKDEPFIQG